MRASHEGFTVIEIMIVVAIIGVLAMICIPNFVQARRDSNKKACISNLHKIEGAVEQAKIAGIMVVGSDELFGPSGYIKNTPPLCPATRMPYTQFDPPACPSGDTTHVVN